MIARTGFFFFFFTAFFLAGHIVFSKAGESGQFLCRKNDGMEMMFNSDDFRVDLVNGDSVASFSQNEFVPSEIDKNDAKAQITPPIEEPDDDGWKQAEYTGIKNGCLVREGKGEPALKLWYPVLDNSVINTTVMRFIEKEAASYSAEAQEAGKEESGDDVFSQWELSGIFFVERPSARAISFTFNTYRYSGGAHGNIFIDCLNFDLETGRQLDINDIFAHPKEAILLLSILSVKKLTESLGEDADEEMIKDGAAPDESNFKNLTLVADGLIIEFQPYQVGPWSIGPQRIKIDLEELAPVGPSPLIWNLPVSKPVSE